MKLRNIFRFNILIALLIASLLLLFPSQGILNRLELIGSDFFFRLRGKLPHSPRIIIIQVTDEDIQQVGSWPWKRTWHAALLRTLTRLGAKSVYFDFLFPEATSEEDDKIFEESLSISGNAYLPFAFQSYSRDITKAIMPLNRLSRHAKGIGMINIYPDIDGILRRIPISSYSEKKLYPNVALRIALDYAGMKIEEANPSYLSISDSSGKFKMPLVDNNYSYLINWSGKWKDTFIHHRFLDVLSEYQNRLENKTSAINLDEFKDSICLVGVTAIGLYDIKPTPTEAEYPTIGIIANIISNVLNKQFIFLPPQWINIFIIYLLAIISALLATGKKPLREISLLLLITGVYFSITFLLFKKGILLSITYPLAGSFITYFIIGTYNFFRLSVEERRLFKMAITDSLTGMYNINYFKVNLQTEIVLSKIDQKRKFCLIMIDIDHFKNFNDTYGHQVGDLVLKETSGVLRSSVRSSDLIARYGGEEIIILLRGATQPEGLRVGEKIRVNTEMRSFGDDLNNYKVTVSIGLASYNPGDEVEAMIKRADDGLYKAKRSGRNTVCTTEELV